MAIATRIPKMVLTMPSSTKVNPRFLPITVIRSVERRLTAGCIDIVDVLTAPAHRVRLVLVRPKPPLHGVRHRIQGNTPQELQLLVDRAHLGYSLHKPFQILGVAFAPQLDVAASYETQVDRLLEVVDGVTDDA